VWGFDLSPTSGILAQLTLGPLGYVYALKKIYGKDWLSKVPRYMFLLLFGEGISLSNSVAFFQGLIGFRGSFDRTPKYGIVSKLDTWREKKYVLPFSWVAGGEIALAAYGILVILVALIRRSFLLVPNIAVQSLGFLYVCALTVHHSLSKKR